MKPKKLPKTAERGIGVMLEQMDSKLDLVLEGQDALSARIDALETRLADLQEEMNYKFEAVFEELYLIRNELKEKVGREEFIVLEKRIIALEKRVSASRK